MSFNEAPLVEVFKKLESQYGLVIIYDEDVLKGCTFTATFGNEGFYEKLNLICKSTNSRYESVDGTIIIFSQVCK